MSVISDMMDAQEVINREVVELRKRVDRLEQKIADGYPPHDHPDRRNTQTPEPKYAVGQYVMYHGALRIITAVVDLIEYNIYEVVLDKNEGAHISDIRPAVPSDFDVRVGNMTVRAYESTGITKMVNLRWSDGSIAVVSENVAAACGYPVCPLSVSGGKFEAPKGEK